jgi:hypothetical protein
MTSIACEFPTPAHKDASVAVTDFFSTEKIVNSVLLTCSCARGRATKDSCLDISILTDPAAEPGPVRELRSRWDAHYRQAPVFAALRSAGKYSQVDLELTSGIIRENPEEHNWTSGPDSFELSIGNLFVYSVPLYGQEYWTLLRTAWMPYYDEPMRKRRLAMVKMYLRNNLDHIPPYIGRQLYFQSHKRLILAVEEFLQALFISRKTYPIAYDKHIREQVEGILKLPELYEQLMHMFEISHFESDELPARGECLAGLAEEYLA